MSEKLRIRIGNQTSVSASLMMQPFEYAVAHGFDAFEWFPDKIESGEGWTEDEISKEARGAIKKTAQAKDISLSVHAPLPSNPLKTPAKETFAKGLEFALDVGASLFNIHFDPGIGIKVYAESILPLIEILSQRNIRLSIENTIDTTPEDFNELFTRLGALPLPDISSVGMCLDIGHANLCRRTRNDYLKYVDLLDSHVPIIHLHMHENYGDFDSHLTVFTGPSAMNTAGIEGLIKRLKEREFSGSIIFEQWPQPPDLLDNARNRLIEMIGDSSEVREEHVDLADEIAASNKRPRAGMIIYNLFPLLAGRLSEWDKHLLRAAEMGFTWIFVNPIQLPGSSGSIYSIKDYFSINPLFIDHESGQTPQEQVKAVTKTAERLGLRMMVDLVINHCAADSDLIKTHPGWFVLESNGRVSHPFAYENGKKVVWKDLAKFDHRNTKDKEGMFRFFLGVIQFLAGLGFKGFRCDAAYQIPGSLWERLIREAKKIYPDLMFFAETLGTTPDLTRKTASSGFDYIFNSSKWWDFESKWLMQQYNLTREVSPSISFAESHDTARLCEEVNGNIEGMKQRYLFSALFSAGVMMPMGFEFGFRKRLHVVKTRPEDWEETGIDLTSFISAVNRIKSGNAIFQEDAPAEILHNPNSRVLFMWKASSLTSDECLLILNKDIKTDSIFMRMT